MDFVDWCDQVLTRVAEAVVASPTARSAGLDQVRLWVAVFGEAVALGSGFHGSDRHVALMHAVTELERAHLVEKRSSDWWKLTDLGERVLPDPVALWAEICKQPLTPERRQVLEAVNRFSPRVSATGDYVWLEVVTEGDLLPALSWPSDGFDLLHAIARELEERHLIGGRGVIGRTVRLQATYQGLVWETRRGWTVEAQEIDRLVEEWETTSVEFKSDVQTDTAAQRAELIKDLLGLANTQASGRRWLIIGFDDKTHRYMGAPNTQLDQDDLERLLHEYTLPYLHVILTEVDYRGGRVPKIEVIRDRRSVPYRVKKDVGDERRGKRIYARDVFVRHGSQTIRADVDEISVLEAEAAWAQQAAREQLL